MRPKSPSQLEAAGAPAEAAELAEMSEALGSARSAPECPLEPFARAANPNSLALLPCARPLWSESRRACPKKLPGERWFAGFHVSCFEGNLRPLTSESGPLGPAPVPVFLPRCLFTCISARRAAVSSFDYGEPASTHVGPTFQDYGLVLFAPVQPPRSRSHPLAPAAAATAAVPS